MPMAESFETFLPGIIDLACARPAEALVVRGGACAGTLPERLSEGTWAWRGLRFACIYVLDF